MIIKHKDGKNYNAATDEEISDEDYEELYQAYINQTDYKGFRIVEWWEIAE